ncbi:hypothetical protein ACF0H5_005494 [Mactra antiquata]
MKAMFAPFFIVCKPTSQEFPDPILPNVYCNTMEDYSATKIQKRVKQIEVKAVVTVKTINLCTLRPSPSKTGFTVKIYGLNLI